MNNDYDPTVVSAETDRNTMFDGVEGERTGQVDPKAILGETRGMTNGEVWGDTHGIPFDKHSRASDDCRDGCDCHASTGGSCSCGCICTDTSWGEIMCCIKEKLCMSPICKTLLIGGAAFLTVCAIKKLWCGK